MIKLLKKLHIIHDWVYIGEWGLIFQQKQCVKCGKLKIINQ